MCFCAPNYPLLTLPRRFETEGAQRQILTKMSMGSWVSTRNKTHRINSNLLFRGEHVLLVREAEEPDTIR